MSEDHPGDAGDSGDAGHSGVLGDARRDDRPGAPDDPTGPPPGVDPDADPAFVVPPPVEDGDRVAVLAPASNLATEFPAVYDLGIERMRERFGLDVVEYPTAAESGDYLYDHPEQRAADVHRAFRDPDVAAAVAVIGGNDQIRMLPHLDPDVLRENPTRFFGYSDNTSLALYLWNLGIVSYQGGMVMTDYAMHGAMFDHTVEYLRRALFEDRVGAIEPAEQFTDEPNRWAQGPAVLETPRATEPSEGWRWENGTDPVEGRVWGGCWEIIDVHLIAERYLPPADRLEGAVLALETSEELLPPATLRQQLIAAGEGGLLERFSAVLVGRAITRSHRRDPPERERREFRERQRAAVTEVLAEYNPGAPVVLDVEFGHTHPTVPLPVGSRVAVDPGDERIEFLGA